MEHENQMPKLQVKSPATSSSTAKSSEVNPKPQSDEWFELLEQTSPIDMLASWSESEPTISQKTMVEELIEREKMSFGVINILLQFVMLKEDMKLPKAYILEIASNWKKKGIKTAKEAYNYAKKVNQPKNEGSSGNYQKRGSYYGQRNRISKEKTPKWLENRDKPSEEDSAKDNSVDDQQLEQDRQAFLDKLSKKWEEDSQ